MAILFLAILVAYFVFTIGLLFVFASALYGFIQTRVPFVATHAADIKQLVQAIILTESDVVYELGSGNGKVVFLIEELSGARVVGFETTLWTYLWALLRKRFKKSRAEFIRKNFWQQPWTEATVIYCYLYPPLMSRIGQKALVDCKPGTRIISRDFAIHSFEPVEVLETPSKHHLYIYKI